MNNSFVKFFLCCIINLGDLFMIIAVVGPTGVGKTKMSIALAKKYNAIIINCDAVQVYKELNIGSAKASVEEQDGVKHYLLDFKEVNEEYNVFDYQKDVRKIIEENKDKNIIIVGGTGLYLSAALQDYRFSKMNDFDYEKYTNEELYEESLKKDQNMKIAKNNRIRLIRFLQKENTEIVKPILLYKTIFIGLTTDRKNLYEIINKRVLKMIDNGLVEEVKTLNEKYKDASILKKAIGYKEIISYLNNEISLEEAINLIQKNSRHYAKRQYTWFNNKMDIKWFNVNYDYFTKTIEEVINYIENSK
ncbi:MAG: tRNA (adenosine(37)-N6)-dimethylallyltransferase MiaA [Firmicutes bacterium]|nr:tRNA (adenosine(37)-N6)-dimethylallyltransferase MiaA [Bacillota bacterium]